MKHFIIALGLSMAAMGAFIAWVAIRYVHDGNAAGSIAGVGILAICAGLPTAWAGSSK